MANQINTPWINPIRFYEVAPTELPQYLSRPFLNYPHLTNNATKPWINQVIYKQKWQTSDTIYLQFESNFDPIKVEVIDCNNIARITQNAVQKRANKYNPGYFVYENTISWATIPPGTYWLKRTLPGGKVELSEPQLVAVTHPNTVLVEYTNSRYHADVIFETGIRFGFRVEGSIGDLDPASKDTFYKDQLQNPTILSSKPYSVFPFNIGGARGVPNWVYHLMMYIWSCNSVTIDGTSYAKFEDSKFEFATEKRYPLRGAAMQIQEGINRGSKIVGVDIDPAKKLFIVSQIDGTVWGDISSQAGSNLIPILSSE